MQVEKTAGFDSENGPAFGSFETVKGIYARVFRAMKPRTPLPEITVRFRQYANANSRIRLQDGHLTVDISDLLEYAPNPVQEALALILLAKLFRRNPDRGTLSLYRRYLNRAEVRRTLHAIKQQRGRKIILEPCGETYNLCQIFEELNLQYFNGLMARPRLGWSIRGSRSVLGHYDPSHHTIVITNLLDSREVPELAVRYVLFHEMLHLRFPIQHRGVKRCVHTREFKNAEKMFEDYKEAQRQLEIFVERAAKLNNLLGRRRLG
jgi:SprT-like family protein